MCRRGPGVACALEAELREARERHACEVGERRAVEGNRYSADERDEVRGFLEGMHEPMDLNFGLVAPGIIGSQVEVVVDVTLCTIYPGFRDEGAGQQVVWRIGEVINYIVQEFLDAQRVRSDGTLYCES